MQKDINFVPAIIQDTISKAIKLLDATGCKYKVIAPDDAEYGELKIQPPAKKVRKINNFRKTGYVDVIKNQKIGEVKIFNPPDGATPKAMQKAIAGTAAVIHGNGNYRSMITETHVEGLRIA